MKMARPGNALGEQVTAKGEVGMESSTEAQTFAILKAHRCLGSGDL